jgi:uncharacterized coiled-coil protein SlyX
MTKPHRRVLKLFAVYLLGIAFMFAGLSSAAAEERAWLAEFNDICAKTDVAMTLSNEELATLLTRCEQLQPALEAEDPSTRKVYLRRLQQCRDLFRFVLESKTPPPQ